MELSEAQQRAREAYRDELDMLAIRRGVTKDRNRLRKVSTSHGVEGLTAEAREELAWWQAANGAVPRDAEAGMRYVVDEMLTVGRGVSDHDSLIAALRSAGFALLDWYAADHRITATKFGSSREGEAREDGNVYVPSKAVEWLAAQFVALDPALAREHPARPGSSVATDAAFRAVRSYQAAQSG